LGYVKNYIHMQYHRVTDIDGTAVTSSKQLRTGTRLNLGETFTIARYRDYDCGMGTNFVAHFQMLGRYNTIANERLYAVCAELPDQEYRREGAGSFRSIHRTLNHILLADQIWMQRFTSSEVTSTPALATILYDEFPALREARVQEDTRLEEFLAGLTEGFLAGQVEYVNNSGRHFADPVTLVLQHVFNHQTHHRGQIHVMLGEFGRTVNLDLHRAIHPEWQNLSQH
jgi:uncharacterized damage-inducible protein DinB